MNRGVIQRSRQAATIGLKCCRAGGMAPRKLVWLSNRAASESPTRLQMRTRDSARRSGPSSVRISLSTRCEPTSTRLRAWKRAATEQVAGSDQVDLVKSAWVNRRGAGLRHALRHVARLTAPRTGELRPGEDPFDRSGGRDLCDAEPPELLLDRESAVLGTKVGDEPLPGVEDRALDLSRCPRRRAVGARDRDFAHEALSPSCSWRTTHLRTQRVERPSTVAISAGDSPSLRRRTASRRSSSSDTVPPSSHEPNERAERNDVLAATGLPERNDLLTVTAERCLCGRHLGSDL